MTRTELLQFAGVVCIIAAIVGGGVKALGYEIGVLNSRKRQVALGLFGLILIAWGPVTTWVSEPRRIASAISSDIEDIATDINRGTVETQETPRGQTDIVPLTEVYVRLRNERSKLGDDLYALLDRKADLALAAAKGAGVGREWDEVNSDIAAELDWP